MLHQTLSFFDHHLGNLNVARSWFVERGGNHFAAHGALHVGHFLWALVDQQNDQRYVWVVTGNRMRDVLQHDGFAGLWRCYQQPTLAFANRGHDVDYAAGNVFFGFDVALKSQHLVRKKWRKVFKQNLVFASFGWIAIDAVEFG